MNFHEVLKQDCSEVFTLFCNLSKPAEDPHSSAQYSSSNVELRGRILALESLLSVLTNAGPKFLKNEAFTSLVKKDLCVTLSKNGVSPNSKDLFSLWR